MPDNSSPPPLSPSPLLSPRLSTVSDAPADEDLLSFAPYAQTLADIVADPTTETPLVIGVFGAWGSGKTSLMRMVERRIEERPADKKTAFPVQPLWFNAWMYSREEALWRALLLHVLRGIRPLLIGNDAANSQLNRIATQLTTTTEAGGPGLTLPGEQFLPGRPGAQVNLPLLAGLRLLQAGLGAGDLDTLIAAVEEAQARSQQERIAALDDFRRTFEQINKEHVEKNGRLVVFVADLTPERVSEYIFLTRSTVEDTAVQLQASKLAIEPQMVMIPAGSFLMGTPPQERDELLRLHKAEDKKFDAKLLDREIGQHTIVLLAFEIGRYPVTNAEFARFMKAGGYDKRELWTEAGWQRKEQEKWTQPRYWTDDKLTKPEQPVVGVSWYEAIAYCRWLTAETGDTKRPYRLPTEAEWERAARGPATDARDSRRYPWGNPWDKQRCNNTELGLRQTTPVGQFSPAGESPEGISDLAGNVWEWCSTRYGGVDAKPKFGYPYATDEREDLEGDDTRIVRGGSWANGSAWCRCGYRNWDLPVDWGGNLGFRCARASS